MNVLAEMLAAREPLFSASLAELATRSSRPDADAQLIAELATKSAASLAKLGVGPHAPGVEAYAALMNKVEIDNLLLASLVGAEDPTNLADLVPKLVSAVQKIKLPRQVMVLKKKVAKAMLQAEPPPGIMKRLGYDNVNTLLRHEDVLELFVALRFAEAPEWLNKFDAGYKQLKAADFEIRDIKMIMMKTDKWGDVADAFVAKKLHNITHSKEMGVIAVVPTTMQRMTGAPLKIMPLLLHYHNEIRLYSAFFKLMKGKKNFGQIIGETLIADTPKINIQSHQHIHWRVIQRYYGKLGKEKHPEVFEPHLQPEDLHWRAAEDILYELDPELGFWKNLDYVARQQDGETLCFNLMDISLGYSNSIGYADRYLYHFRESLWNEIFSRYMGADVLRQQILERLDNDIIKPEEL